MWLLGRCDWAAQGCGREERASLAWRRQACRARRRVMTAGPAGGPGARLNGDQAQAGVAAGLTRPGAHTPPAACPARGRARPCLAHELRRHRRVKGKSGVFGLTARAARASTCMLAGGKWVSRGSHAK